MGGREGDSGLDASESPVGLTSQRHYVWWLRTGILESDTLGSNPSSAIYQLYDIEKLNLSKTYLHNM